MPTYIVRLVSLALFAVLCAVTTYWVILLSNRQHRIEAEGVVAEAPSTRAAAQLFGGSPVAAARQEFKLVGILSLGPGQGAAAILSASDGPAQTWALGQRPDGNTRLAEIRERSVILERSGVRSEIFLPAVAGQVSGYLR